MPTVLPRRRRVEAKQSFVSVLFNTFLVVSAVAFAFVVLVREEEYAFGQSEAIATEQPAQGGTPATTEDPIIQPE